MFEPHTVHAAEVKSTLHLMNVTQSHRLTLSWNCYKHMLIQVNFAMSLLPASSIYTAKEREKHKKLLHVLTQNAWKAQVSSSPPLPSHPALEHFENSRIVQRPTWARPVGRFSQKDVAFWLKLSLGDKTHQHAMTWWFWFGLFTQIWSTISSSASLTVLFDA